MAKLNLKYYDGKNIYNDGNVEEKLLEHYKSGKPLDQTKEDIFYLVTDVRKNILNWYPFTKQDEVLEIGCGCGTLTGTLCEKCQNVVCVEGSKRRAEITYYRHQNKDNLEVYAGNFNDIKIKQKFDYIILIGVFEYAKLFFDSNNPFDEFLEKIKKLLKSTGKVLLAIENRYGIKYWAGANEDHIVKPYVGLEGYDSYKVQTFGKTEFIDLITRHGFTKNKFYYPLSKDRKGKYIDNQKNSISIEIKMIDNDETYNMETLYAGGMDKFVKYYNEIQFKCTKLEYHKATHKVKYLLFEQITE